MGEKREAEERREAEVRREAEERKRIEEERKKHEEERRRQEESAGARYDLPPEEDEEENFYENNDSETPQAGDGRSITAVALYDYQAMAEDEISFDPNDMITNIEMIEEGWWLGFCNGRRGLFPANFVELTG